MTVLKLRYSKEDFARRGQAIYERDSRPHIKAGDQGKFIAIDIEPGAYGIDGDDYTATERLLVRSPTAQKDKGKRETQEKAHPDPKARRN